MREQQGQVAESCSLRRYAEPSGMFVTPLLLAVSFLHLVCYDCDCKGVRGSTMFVPEFRGKITEEHAMHACMCKKQ